MASDSPLRNLSVVLVEPTGPANVGLAARATKAFGLGGLRIVGRVPGGPGEASAWAARAADALAAARLFPTLDAAVADCAFRVGTASARGGLGEDVELRAPREAAAEILAAAARAPVALLFGPEANGLPTETLLRCTLVCAIPTSPDYPSLNLAQAVTAVAYELASTAAPPSPSTERADPAEAALLEERLLRLLRRVGFTDQRQQNRAAYPVRRLLARARATPRDVRLLLGVLAHLERRIGP
ncbi:MAG: hypothetical protein L0216_21640 [Planctomycetales bacterium]|nr:hypothetical protein [Planctomycetales bacterium]